MGGDFIPYESFEKLEEAKKQNIINAGFMVFAEHGYAKASVDEIVKAADISKGSLFYYFESKKNFYLYLYEYCGVQLGHLVDSPGPDGRPTYMAYDDFFDRLNAIHIIKTKHSIEYPHMYNFMKKAVFDTSEVIQEEISKVNIKFSQERAMLFFHGINYSKFKEGIDPKMIIQLITWTSEGCVNQVALKSRMNPSHKNPTIDFDEVVQLSQSYIDLFRKSFYKEEYL